LQQFRKSRAGPEGGGPHPAGHVRRPERALGKVPYPERDNAMGPGMP
jgi:hypothetical protein